MHILTQQILPKGETTKSSKSLFSGKAKISDIGYFN